MENFTLGPIQTEWLKQMKEHPEWQGTQQLGYTDESGKQRMCCLGLGGLIVGECRWVNGRLITKDRGQNRTLDDQAYRLLGLRSGVGSSSDDLSRVQPSLAQLNDNGRPWPQIVDIIRSNPGVYFTRSV